MKIIKLKFLILLIISFSINSQQKLTQLRFIPHWVPQAQFAGYYVAYENGLYKKYGIELKILTGGPSNSSSQFLEKGKADIASLWLSNAIELKEKGNNIVNIAQLFSKSAMILVAKKKSGIAKAEDLNNKKVGIWGGDFRIQPLEFFNKYNLKVNVVQQGSSINLFLMDGVDITSAMTYNEYHTMLNSGLRSDELVVFKFSDYGLNFPEDGLYCKEELLKENPEAVKNFLKATLEGWKLAFDNPEKTLQIIKKYMNEVYQPFNKSHQKWMLEKMKEYMFPDNRFDRFAELKKDEFDNMTNLLLKQKFIKNKINYEEIYKPQLKGDR